MAKTGIRKAKITNIHHVSLVLVIVNSMSLGMKDEINLACFFLDFGYSFFEVKSYMNIKMNIPNENMLYLTGGYSKNVIYIGNISMEIYLYHMMVFRIIEKMHLNIILGNGIAQYIFTVILVLIGAISIAIVFNKIKIFFMFLKLRKYSKL